MYERHLRTIGHGLVLVAAMLGLVAAALWLKPASLESVAEARLFKADEGESRGIPDAGRQRLMILQELKGVNERLARLEKGFREGEFSVKALEEDEGDAR